jgi:hypothetical protein
MGWLLQDFTTFTEVDPESELTVSSDEIVCACPGTDILGEHILNVYKDFGVGSIDDFSYKFAFSVSPKQETDGLVGCCICGVTESSLNWYDYSYINGSDGILVVVLFASPWDETPSLQLYGCGSIDNLVIAFNTTYYVLITRSGSAISCKVYSDPSYETLIQELTGTYSDACRYTILTMPDTYDPRPEAQANASFRGSVSDLYIEEANQVVETPTADPVAGAVYFYTLVSLSCATLGATIRFTINGSEPTEVSPIYTSPIPILYPMTIKAKGFKDGMDDSETGSFTYTLLYTPMSIGGGFYASKKKNNYLVQSDLLLRLVDITERLKAVDEHKNLIGHLEMVTFNDLSFERLGYTPLFYLDIEEDNYVG